VDSSRCANILAERMSMAAGLREESSLEHRSALRMGRRYRRETQARPVGSQEEQTQGS
jgi:hypothetical protein